MLATKSKGNSATFYSELTSENPADIRHLNAGDQLLEGSIDKTRSDMLQVWNDHTHGASEVVDFQFDNVSHSLAVKLSTQQLGATDENDANGTCDVYDNIKVEGVVSYIYLCMNCANVVCMIWCLKHFIAYHLSNSYPFFFYS